MKITKSAINEPITIFCILFIECYLRLLLSRYLRHFFILLHYEAIAKGENNLFLILVRQCLLIRPTGDLCYFMPLTNGKYAKYEKVEQCPNHHGIGETESDSQRDR